MGEAIELSAEYARARSRGPELGMPAEDYLAWRRYLRADYTRIGRSSRRGFMTALFTGALFMLVDPTANAEIGITMCNRAMTADEREQYTRSPASTRRRKPGSTVDDDEERARRRRAVELEKQIASDTRGTVIVR